MRHFRLKFILTVGAIICLTALAATLICQDMYPQGIFAILGVAASCIALHNLVDRLKQTVWTFAKSLEVNDTGIIFDSQSDDRVVSETLNIFNRLITLFHTTTLELETRKLYYDRILRVMTHEMGNSITPVITICSDIRRHPEKYTLPRLEEAMDIVSNRASDINRFLKAYYRLTHIPSLRLHEISSTELMYKIRPLVEAELNLRNIDKDLCPLSVSGSAILNIDTGLISQVIVNLLRNALDAVADKDEPIVTITLSATDSHPYITIEDNGAGIRNDIQDDLFQPFVTTKSKGSGVGLYLSRQIMRQHGGDLRLCSISGKGTRAIAYFKI